MKRKFIITAELRALEKEVALGEMSYSRMIEILCEKANEYSKPEWISVKDMTFEHLKEGDGVLTLDEKGNIIPYRFFLGGLNMIGEYSDNNRKITHWLPIPMKIGTELSHSLKFDGELENDKLQSKITDLEKQLADAKIEIIELRDLAITSANTIKKLKKQLADANKQIEVMREVLVIPPYPITPKTDNKDINQ